MNIPTNYISLDLLSDSAQLTLRELASIPSKGYKGYTRLSQAHIRRLEERGLFPKSRRIAGTRCKFYLAGEVKQWLADQAKQEG